MRAIGDARIAAQTRVPPGEDSIDVPSFHTAGWFDVFLQGTLDNFQAMAKGGEACLLVGPWAHERFIDPVGERLFGFQATRDGVPVHQHGAWGDHQLAWFDEQMRPDSGVAPVDSPVRIFVMGRNEWRDEPTWPLERVSHERS